MTDPISLAEVKATVWLVFALGMLLGLWVGIFILAFQAPSCATVAHDRPHVCVMGRN